MNNLSPKSKLLGTHFPKFLLCPISYAVYQVRYTFSNQCGQILLPLQPKSHGQLETFHGSCPCLQLFHAIFILNLYVCTVQ
jgi:hypothetical protein